MAAPLPQNLLKNALAAHQAGQFRTAASLYAQVRRTTPGAFDAWHLGGLLELQQQNVRVAADLLARARSLNPKHALCAMRHGIALQAIGQLPAAIDALTVATTLDSVVPEAWFHLGSVLASHRQTDAATSAWRQALELKSDYAEVHDRWGTLAVHTSGHAAAISHFEAATRANANWPQAWCNLGISLINTGRTAEALDVLEHTLGLDPMLNKARTALGLLYQQTYRLRDAVSTFSDALAANPHDHEARSGYLLTLNYLDDLSAVELTTAHRAFGDALTRPAGPLPSRSNKKRLHIAFLSPDLRRHSVAYFLLPLLKHLDRQKFRISLLHDHAIEDEMSAELREHADHWFNYRGLSHEAALRQLRLDSPDVLFDLAGHTGINRLSLFAHRAAPLQINYLGYPNTTGLRTMDFRFVDAITDPPGSADALATEKLIRFAPTAWAYAPPAEAPTVPDLPSIKAKHITLGSFNNYAKVSERTIELWSHTLAAIPHSRLLLKSQDLDQTDITERIQKDFADHGISADRLILRGRTSSMAEHLALYGEIDIALDTFPYHGTTTTCEALWMGRPVITLAGDRHASRVGASLLKTIGHPEWVAQSDEEFITIVSELASQPDQLIKASTELRDALGNSPLLDHEAQARRFGDAILTCWNGTNAQPAAAFGETG